MDQCFFVFTSTRVSITGFGHKLPQICHLFERRRDKHAGLVGVAWSSAVQNDLQTKMERYETKATHCSKAAQEAPDEPGRAFYEELAQYYGELASDFRRVLAKRAGVAV